MRSFSNYRKQCLVESLDGFSAKGSSSALFDILKIDLLEAVCLPDLLTENTLLNSDFNRFKRDHDWYNKRIVECICDYSKQHFYNELLSETDTMVRTPGNPTAMLVGELKKKLADMIAQLKQTVAGSVAGPADVPQDDEE